MSKRNLSAFDISWYTHYTVSSETCPPLLISDSTHQAILSLPIIPRSIGFFLYFNKKQLFRASFVSDPLRWPFWSNQFFKKVPYYYFAGFRNHTCIDLSLSRQLLTRCVCVCVRREGGAAFIIMAADAIKQATNHGHCWISIASGKGVRGRVRKSPCASLVLMSAFLTQGNHPDLGRRGFMIGVCKRGVFFQKCIL